MEYNFTKANVNLTNLLSELTGFNITGLIHTDGIVTITVPETLNRCVLNEISAVINLHDANDPLGPVKSVIRRAVSFGAKITAEFAAENVAMGITQAGKTKLIADTCQQAFYYLSTGSLYEARTAMLELVLTEEMSPYLTEARLISFINKLETYLGLSLTTER